VLGRVNERESMSENRIARFRVRKHMDGKPEFTLEISYDDAKGDGVVSVRPLGSRLEYTYPLSGVGEIVQAKHAKFLAQQKGISVPRARR
jgi:hypothetical protein